MEREPIAKDERSIGDSQLLACMYCSRLTQCFAIVLFWFCISVIFFLGFLFPFFLVFFLQGGVCMFMHAGEQR